VIHPIDNQQDWFRLDHLSEKLTQNPGSDSALHFNKQEEWEREARSEQFSVFFCREWASARTQSGSVSASKCKSEERERKKRWERKSSLDCVLGPRESLKAFSGRLENAKSSPSSKKVSRWGKLNWTRTDNNKFRADFDAFVFNLMPNLCDLAGVRLLLLQPSGQKNVKRGVHCGGPRVPRNE
jgi:hypothetical protein